MTRRRNTSVNAPCSYLTRRGVSSSGFRHVTTQRMKAPSTVANGLASGCSATTGQRHEDTDHAITVAPEGYDRRRNSS
jgi:hypothetical protein